MPIRGHTLDAGGSPPVVEMNVTQSTSDARELAATVGATQPQLVLTDAGYANKAQVEALHEQDILSLLALGTPSGALNPPVALGFVRDGKLHHRASRQERTHIVQASDLLVVHVSRHR